MEKDKMTKESRDELLERILEETARKPYKPTNRTANRTASARPTQTSQPVGKQPEFLKKEQHTQVFSAVDVNSEQNVQSLSSEEDSHMNKVAEQDLTQVIPAQRDFDLNAMPVHEQNNSSQKQQRVTPQEMQSAAEKIQKIKQEKAAAAKAAIMQKAEIDSKRMMQQTAEQDNFSMPSEPPVFSVSEDEKVNIVTNDDYDYEEDYKEENQISDVPLSIKIHSIIQWALYTSFLIIVVFTSVFSFASVSGDSMLPTLGDGNKLFTIELGYAPKRGDVVIIDSQTAALFDENENIIEKEALGCMISKRIIAVGGDTIDFDFEKGTVKVNDTVLDESYISEPTTRNEMAAFEYPLTIPQGYVFVLGDNRNISMDSRHEKIGLVPEAEICGKVIAKIYPFGSFGAVD